MRPPPDRRHAARRRGAARSVLAALAIAVVALTAAAAEALVFDDGLVHVIDASNPLPHETAFVEDGADGAPTTLVVLEGGSLGGMEIGGRSIGWVSGGSVGDVVHRGGRFVLRGGSVASLVAEAPFALEGGSIAGAVICTACRSARVASGDFAHVVLDRLATGEITGGAIAKLEVQLRSRVRITGGEIAEILATGDGSEGLENTRVAILGGRFGTLALGEVQVTVEIAGGVFEGDVENGGYETQLRIFGGSFGGTLYARAPYGDLFLFGKDFDRPYGDVSDTWGRLVGTLASGEPIDVPFARNVQSFVMLAPFPPAICDIEMSQDVYTTGDVVYARVLRYANPASIPLTARLRLLFTMPYGWTTEVIDVGAAGEFAMPPGFDLDLAPVRLFYVPPDIPRGRYQLWCAIEDPTSGARHSQERFWFEIQ